MGGVLWSQRSWAGYAEVACPAVSRDLSTREVPLVQADDYVRPEEADDEVLAATLESLGPERAAVVFDGPVACLASDLHPGTATVAWRRGTFFDSLVTNLAPERVRRPDGTEYRPDDHRGALADHIGVTILVLTRDGWWVTPRSSRSAVGSPGRLLPGGSGACEPSDMEDASGFREGVLAAGSREMTEECGLPVGTRHTSWLTGVSLDLTRRRKPQVWGLAILDVEASAVGSEGEDAFTDDLVLTRCDGDPVNGAASLLRDPPSDAGTPLLAALNHLVDATWLHDEIARTVTRAA